MQHRTTVIRETKCINKPNPFLCIIMSVPPVAVKCLFTIIAIVGAASLTHISFITAYYSAAACYDSC